nr:exo-alpha-sialidase [Betaproteobacteria bacterium]
NAEVEPYLAVNPRNPNNLVGVWQQDRWSDGAAAGLRTGFSFDGGRTWGLTAATFSRCTGGNAGNGGDYERATDPWVTFAPDGSAFQIALAISGESLTPGSANAILVSRSVDGGRAWSNPITLIRDGADAFNDKESITADPTDARYVYAVWDRLPAAGGGPSYFSRTTDGGASWETARPIFDPGAKGQTINNQIVVLPNGTLVNFFTHLEISEDNIVGSTLQLIRSTDKGATWSAPADIAEHQALGVSDPTTGVPIRDGSILGAIAVGRNGVLAAVWQDARFSSGARDGIAFSRSLDGGSTWSAPVRINREPAVQAFIPAVTIRDDGAIGVTYFDFRSDTTARATLLTDYWLTQSTDGVTWRESRVAGPFNYAIAPIARGLFLGDYMGLTSIGTTFVPFYTTTNDSNFVNRTDVFATLATSPGSAATAKIAEADQDASTSPMRAEAARPLPPTPELQKRLHDAVVRTLERRVPGWTPRGLKRNPDPGPR